MEQNVKTVRHPILFNFTILFLFVAYISIFLPPNTTRKFLTENKSINSLSFRNRGKTFALGKGKRNNTTFSSINPSEGW